MSLQVWLPLTKDLRNQGLSNITSSGTPVYKDSGKLGNRSLDLNTRVTFNCPAMANKSTFSVAFWAKVNTDTSLTTNWVDVIGFTDQTSGGSNGQLRWETCYASGYETRGISSHDNVTNAISNSFGSIIGTTKGIWYHIACTVDIDNNVINEYRNGEIVHTIIPNGGHLTGAFWIGETGKINGEIQDVRIYDHALSQMEVKELSKGLVLHYPLNRQGWGQENLVLHTYLHESDWWTGNTSGATVSNNKVTIQAAGEFYQKYSSLPTTSVPSGTTLTLSCYFYENTISTGNRRIYYACSPSWLYVTVPANFTGLFTSTFTTTAELTKLTIDYDTRNWTSGKWVCGPCKLEYGSIATPWCPNSSDTLATTMGLNSTTEYDCSGFCNNGTRTGTFTWTSDTPKYSVSTQFNGTQVIQLPFSCSVISEAITVACWGYESNWNTSSAERLIGAATNSSGWCIGDYGSENTLFAFYANGGYNVATGFKQLTAGWHHFVITFDGLNLKYYVDGQQFSSKTFSTKQVAIGNYNIEIGRHYGDGCNFKGRMSDVRIYATALSASDVKSLYQNSAYIDSSGNVYGTIHEV